MIIGKVVQDTIGANNALVVILWKALADELASQELTLRCLCHDSGALQHMVVRSWQAMLIAFGLLNAERNHLHKHRQLLHYT